jgi:methionyl-tRNA formyltransferase
MRPRLRIAFFGTPDFAVPTLHALASRHEVAVVVAQPDKPAGRGLSVHVPPTVVAARQLGLPVAQPRRIRDPGFFESIRSIAPELCVVVAYGKILPADLLEIPRRGFLNVHASVLPKYRGAAPIQRAIEQGERETGITIMRVDEELDHGPILAIERAPIDPDEHAPRLSARLAEMGASLLFRTIDDLAAGRAVEKPQDHAAATYAPKIEKAEGRVDWTMSARQIYDRFRGFDPWPGVFVNFRDEALKLLDMVPVGSPAPGTASGAIVGIERDAVLVATVDGSLRITSAQRPGRRSTSGGELARSNNFSIGAIFR